MKIRFILSLLISLIIASNSFAQVTYSSNGDTVYITGGTMTGGENTGMLEAVINSDTTESGARKNPNRVYALNEGQVYYQVLPINVYNPTGTLTIVSVHSLYGKTKPIILINPTNGTDVTINVNGVNQVYGSLKFVNIYYQTMQLDGYQNNELFYCGTANKLPQSLTIDNCLFEFCNIDLFDCSNEPGAIGGWPYGAKFRITNSYFRNLFNPEQWWGSRVFQCTHPIDTLWIENCTVTTGGLTFLQRNALTDFAYINHNTIINNMKYWLFSKYYKTLYVCNNIFINQNWVGEDTNVVNHENPRTGYQSTIDIDSINAADGVVVQQKYYAGDSSHYYPILLSQNSHIFVSNNINYYDPMLINGYYNSSTYINSSLGTPPSYLNWAGLGSGPWKIGNIPGMWLNQCTKDLFAKYSPVVGGLFIEENTITDDPHTLTPGIADASVVRAMAIWNQNQWGDPKFKDPGDITSGKYIYGDYNPLTLPGMVNRKPSDSVTGEGTGIQVGITKFTDLTENFSQSAHFSKIDNLPIGALIWDDARLAAYNSAADYAEVYAKYSSEGGGCNFCVIGVNEEANLRYTYSLSQNYPNPFNPTTIISWQLAVGSFVTLKVYDILGREVKTLVNEIQSAGNHAVKFNAGGLSTGIYLYRIEAGNFTETKKLLLLK